MKINTKHILDIAYSRADVSNSDYYSYKENYTALNDGWTSLYEKAINIGEKFFVKTLEVKTDVIDLPEDFFQLESVRDFYGYPIDRVNNITELNSVNGYCLMNNKLYLNYEGSVYVGYYPVPETLSLYIEDKRDFDITLDYDNNIWTMYCACKGGKWRLYESEYKVLKTDGITFEILDYKPTFIDINGNVNPENTPAMREDFETVYYIKNDFVYECGKPNEELVEARDISNKYFYVENGHVVGTDTYTEYVNGNPVTLNDYEGDKFENTPLFYYDHDPIKNTGIIIKSGDKYFIDCPFKTNTINIPNNTYIQTLANKLALYLRAKAGLDTTLQVKMLTDSEYTFADTLRQDTNAPVRIKNVNRRIR